MNPTLYIWLSTLISSAFLGDYTYMEDERSVRLSDAIKATEPLMYFDDAMEVYYRDKNKSEEEARAAFHQLYQYITKRGDYDALINDKLYQVLPIPCSSWGESPQAVPP